MPDAEFRIVPGAGDEGEQIAEGHHGRIGADDAQGAGIAPGGEAGGGGGKTALDEEEGDEILSYFKTRKEETLWNR